MTYQLPEDYYPVIVPHPTLGVPIQIGYIDYTAERAELIKGDVFIIFDFITKYQDELTFTVFTGEEELTGLSSGQHLLIQKDEEGNVLPINTKVHGYIGLPFITEEGRHTSAQFWGLKDGIINLTNLHYPLDVNRTLDRHKYFLTREEIKEELVEQSSNIIQNDFTFLNKTYQGYYIDSKFYVDIQQIVRGEEDIWNLSRSIDKENFKYIAVDRHNNIELVDKSAKLLLTQRKVWLISWDDLVSKITFENKK